MPRTLGIEPRAFCMQSGRDATTPHARSAHGHASGTVGHPRLTPKHCQSMWGKTALLWMIPSEAPKALQASERSARLRFLRAVHAVRDLLDALANCLPGLVRLWGKDSSAVDDSIGGS